MALPTYQQLANEIITETGLGDITSTIFTYLYDTVKSICGLREDWSFLLHDTVAGSVGVGTGYWAVLGNRIGGPSQPPHRTIELVRFKNPNEDTVYFPSYRSPAEFARLWTNMSTSRIGHPKYWTITPFPVWSGQIPDTIQYQGERVTWMMVYPLPDKTYNQATMYYFEPPASTPGDFIYIPNTEMVKAGTKVRIYGDRGVLDEVETQSTIYQIGLKDLINRYGNVVSKEAMVKPY